APGRRDGIDATERRLLTGLQGPDALDHVESLLGANVDVHRSGVGDLHLLVVVGAEGVEEHVARVAEWAALGVGARVGTPARVHAVARREAARAEARARTPIGGNGLVLRVDARGTVDGTRAGRGGEEGRNDETGHDQRVGTHDILRFG